MLPRLTALSFAIRADSFSSTPKQILILSCARRFLFFGTKNQRKVASARPIFIAKSKGKAQIILLKSLKNVYEIIKTTPKNKIKRDLQISRKNLFGGEFQNCLRHIFLVANIFVQNFGSTESRKVFRYIFLCKEA